MLRRLGVAGVVAICTCGLLAAPASAAVGPFEDVPSSHYAAAAIRQVAVTNDWIRGAPSRFGPSSRLTRRVLARALVLVFAREDLDAVLDPPPPPEPCDPLLETCPEPPPPPPALPEFTDLPSTDPWYPYAAIARSKGWLPGPTFSGTGSVSKRVLDRALVRALGLQDAATALANLRTANGHRLPMPTLGEYMAIAHELRLHHNFPSKHDRSEYYPWDAVNRAYGAYALSAAVRAADGWGVWSARRYESISLPAMNAAQLAAARFAVRYIGYPYVYAGEWHRAAGQPHGGFDCSGFAWWVMKKSSPGWTAWEGRPYAGWGLGGRRGRDMARVGKRRAFGDLRPMDLLFWDTDNRGTGSWDSTGHVGMFLGDGWMIHSSGGRDGVTISWMGDGYWRDTLLWGRRLIY